MAYEDEGKTTCCDCGEVYSPYFRDHHTPDACIQYLTKRIKELEERIVRQEKEMNLFQRK